MKQLERYINKQKNEYLSHSTAFGYAMEMVVVIPCYNEPDIKETLHSLMECLPPKKRVGVIVVINSGTNSPLPVVEQNRQTYNEMLLFAAAHNSPSLSFHAFIFENLPRKHAGVGLARKIGMDIAVTHFLNTRVANGIIISLDADCTVSDNFLMSIAERFHQEKNMAVSVHNFYHRVIPQNDALESAVRQYERYIHYFSDMLRLSGFPYYYHTIGSAFAVSADAYVRVGGMGRQQGGEDFYFLQKVFALGKVYQLNETTVYPLARFSERVPFGTGPALSKIIRHPQEQLLAYTPESFGTLKKFFDQIDTFYKQSPEVIATILDTLHPTLNKFLKETDGLENLRDCNDNCASLGTFRKRFFHHFNAFKIIKYLNYAHQTEFELEPLSDCIKRINNIHNPIPW